MLSKALGRQEEKREARKEGATVLCAEVPVLQLDLLHWEGTELGGKRDRPSGSSSPCRTAEWPHASSGILMCRPD